MKVALLFLIAGGHKVYSITIGTVVLDLAGLMGSSTRSIQCLKAAHYFTLQPTLAREEGGSHNNDG